MSLSFVFSLSDSVGFVLISLYSPFITLLLLLTLPTLPGFVLVNKLFLISLTKPIKLLFHILIEVKALPESDIKNVFFNKTFLYFIYDPFINYVD